MRKRTNPLKIIDGFLGKYLLDKAQSRHDQTSAMHYPANSNIFLIDEHSFSLSIYLNKKIYRNDVRHLIQNLGSVNALFYGEIYNLDELWDLLSIENHQKSHISLSHICCLLYKRLGYEFAKKINGVFSIILWDRDDDTLLLIADRFGLARPIFYRISKGVVFSNRLRLLVRAKDVDAEVDSDSVALFMKYAYIPAPKTIFRGIEKLNHGEMLICRGHHITKERYITFDEVPDRLKNVAADDLAELYLETLGRSINRKLNVGQDERPGCFLSGGLDSGACVAIASRVNQKKIKTFGVGFEDASLDERPFARIVAHHFGFPYYDYVLDGNEIERLPEIILNLEEPFMENGLFLTHAGFKAASNHTDVIIASDGADQLFGTGGFAGCRPIALRYLLDKARARLLADKLRSVTKIRPFYGDSFLYKIKVMWDRTVDFNDWFFWGFDRNELKKMFSVPVSEEAMKPFLNKIPKQYSNFSEYYQFATIHQDIEHYACQNVLVKSFRIADMFGVTVREAYLDNDVTDFLMEISLGSKRRGSLLDHLLGRTQAKYIHKLAFSNILPPEILKKPKQGGFVPMDLMMKNQSRRLTIYDYILRSRIIRESFNVKYIKILLSEFEELSQKPIYWQAHRDAKANRVLYLLVISLWYDIFFEKRYFSRPPGTLSEFIEAM